MDSQAAGVDRISALPDDVLHVVLGRLGYAPAVSKTAVLSRRWRHLWTRAKSLTFKDTDRFLINKSDFARFVDWVLAQRGNDADLLESLEIHVEGEHCSNGVISPEKVNEWLRYAAQHVVGSVRIVDEQLQHHAVVELPSHVITASISLDLPYYRLRLPAAGKYEALKNLKLSLSFDEEGGSTLGGFVASCCPRLRRLHIIGTDGLRQLVLRSDALEALDISAATHLQKLEVVAPNLRAIRMSMGFLDLVSNDDAVAIDNKVVRITTPKLEEISRMDYFRNKPYIHDLTGVRRLTWLYLGLHGKYHRDMDVGTWLLENCPGVEHADVNLKHDARCELAVGEQLVDLTSSERNAPFAKLRSMVVRAYCFSKHHLVASISSLLSRCPNLTSLRVEISSIAERSYRCFCDALTDRAVDQGKIVLESLEEVNINGFSGRDEDMQLVRLLFETSSSIKRMVLKRIPAGKKTAKWWEQQPADAKDAMTIYQELKKNPCADRGRWHPSKNTFTWKCDAIC